MPLSALPTSYDGTGLRIYTIIPEHRADVSMIRSKREKQPPLPDVAWRLTANIDLQQTLDKPPATRDRRALSAFSDKRLDREGRIQEATKTRILRTLQTKEIAVAKILCVLYPDPQTGYPQICAGRHPGHQRLCQWADYPRAQGA